MSPIEIKEALHKIIDDINDNEMLVNFYEIMSDYTSKSETGDIIEELDSSQKERLANSIEQSFASEVVMDKKAKDEIYKWLKK